MHRNYFTLPYFTLLLDKGAVYTEKVSNINFTNSLLCRYTTITESTISPPHYGLILRTLYAECITIWSRRSNRYSWKTCYGARNFRRNTESEKPHVEEVCSAITNLPYGWMMDRACNPAAHIPGELSKPSLVKIVLSRNVMKTLHMFLMNI